MKKIDWDYKIDTDWLTLRIEKGKREGFFLRRGVGKVTLICPPSTDFSDIRKQRWLQNVVVEALRKQAHHFLPKRLNELAEQYGFSFNRIVVKKVRTRWGSCSGLKNINLSIYLMLLPLSLIDYVLLHELCHTREMNHGPRFWALLDSVTNNKAHELRTQLRKIEL